MSRPPKYYLFIYRFCLSYHPRHSRHLTPPPSILSPSFLVAIILVIKPPPLLYYLDVNNDMSSLTLNYSSSKRQSPITPRWIRPTPHRRNFATPPSQDPLLILPLLLTRQRLDVQFPRPVSSVWWVVSSQLTYKLTLLQEIARWGMG